MSGNSKLMVLGGISLLSFFIYDKREQVAETMGIETQQSLNQKIANFTKQAGTLIIENCARSSPVRLERRYTTYQTLPKNPNRLRINMYVAWEGRSSCEYRVNGILFINKDGTRPTFTLSSTSAPGIICVLEEDRIRSIQWPESFDLPK